MYAVRAVLHAYLGGRAEVAVVQTFVALVVAALLQGDSFGQAGHTDVDHQLLAGRRQDRWQRFGLHQVLDFSSILRAV